MHCRFIGQAFKGKRSLTIRQKGGLIVRLLLLKNYRKQMVYLFLVAVSWKQVFLINLSYPFTTKCTNMHRKIC